MRKELFFCLVVSIGLAFGLHSFFARAQNDPGAGTATSTESSASISLKDQLEKRIQEKASELQEINKQLIETQKNLNETKSERLSLQKELSRLQYTANQLRLNIQSDELSIQKLDLEIQSLTFDIQDIQSSIKDKKEAVGGIFREIQQNSQSSLLVIFLKNKSLADGILEAQSLNDLNTKLVVDITNLKELHEDLSERADQSDAKRDEALRHQKNLQNRKFILQDQQKERTQLLSETKNKESVYEKQVADLRKQQQDIADEIESIDAELRAKIDLSLLPSVRAGVLGVPIEGAAVLTQGYGSTDFAKSAYAGGRHNGIDFRASVGTPILAAEAGVVAAAGDQDSYRGCYRGAYGKFIVINHNNNLTTLYAHLSRNAVAKGEQVTRGQVIGYAGKSGYATGPHLHFTVFAQPTFYMGPSRVCGPMPFGGDLSPLGYLELSTLPASTAPTGAL